MLGWRNHSAIRTSCRSQCTEHRSHLLVAPRRLRRPDLIRPHSSLWSMAARPPLAAAAAPAAASVPPSADGLEDADPPEVFVESTWRTRQVRYDREQQSEAAPPKDAAVQSRIMRSGGVRSTHTHSSQPRCQWSQTEGAD